MKILIIEPYFTGSHAAWAEGYKKNSQHEVEILSLSGQFWKWRMHGGAITLAKKYIELKNKPDFILATDMLDLTTFLSLTRPHTSHIPIGIYFHENQLCYPWSPDDRDILHKRDKHYGFINYSSALAADAVFFNSEYHKNSLLSELQRFLKHFPDHRELENIDIIAQKSKVLHLGLDLIKFDRFVSETEKSNNDSQPPLIIWNHRWEYDKNPKEFFQALFEVNDSQIDFRLAILGENFSKSPIEFEMAQQILKEKIVHFGFVENFEEYAGWLCKADILPITSNQDFFGGSIVEAIYCGCIPILPKRLTYPELIPQKKYSNNFYDNFDDLVDKLKALIQNYNKMQRQNLSAVVKKYCWQKMAPYYDEEFTQIYNLIQSI